ncbi:WRKY domain-containing protein [Psidium guajava]|nr:WRKY domain-containing protein [Psidium guajava]
MSDSTNFRPLDSPDMDFNDNSDFELSEFLKIDELFGGDPASVVHGAPANSYFYPANEADDYIGSSSNPEAPSEHAEGGREKKEVKERFAFKTKSDVEILDDGFKWRKYGKKMVKNSPNPRNYYRCSVEGCPVKKRVERDRDDPGYVITTYEGIHNHQGPF